MPRKEEAHNKVTGRRIARRSETDEKSFFTEIKGQNKV